MTQRPAILSFTAAQPEQPWHHPFFTPRSLRDLIEDEPVEETGEVPDWLEEDQGQEAADLELRAVLLETLQRQGEAFGPLITAAAARQAKARRRAERGPRRRPSAVVATAWSLALAVALATLAVLAAPDDAHAAVRPAAAATLRAGA